MSGLLPIANFTVSCFIKKDDTDKKSLKIPKPIIRIRKSKKDRQHNSQKKNDKLTNNDLQNTTQKTKD